MKKPDEMSEEAWRQFCICAQSNNVYPGRDHPADVEPWLATWLDGFKYGREHPGHVG